MVTLPLTIIETFMINIALITARLNAEITCVVMDDVTLGIVVGVLCTLYLLACQVRVTVCD